MKQQADKEMTSIRRILDILGALAPSQQARVMAFVNGRVADGSIATPPSPLSDVKLAVDSNGEIARQRPQLPFPDADATKRAMDGLGAAGAALGGALVGNTKVDVKQ